MINYLEKGIGLHEAIKTAGFQFGNHDGEWISNDDVAVQAIIDRYTLDQTKAVRSNEVNQLAKSKRDQVVQTYSYGETSSWPVKANEVIAFTASGNPADAPMLAIEAQARGVPLQEIVDRVRVNAQSFSQLEAQISGVSGRHRDTIQALDSFEAVAAYDITTGWPA